LLTTAEVARVEVLESPLQLCPLALPLCLHLAVDSRITPGPCASVRVGSLAFPTCVRIPAASARGVEVATARGVEVTSASARLCFTSSRTVRTNPSASCSRATPLLVADPVGVASIAPGLQLARVRLLLACVRVEAARTATDSTIRVRLRASVCSGPQGSGFRCRRSSSSSRGRDLLGGPCCSELGSR
jgi:hypothetical protein